ncbi:reverse transcriptase-like protein [Sutcliffiella horikoshii]|uniref:reverse transcriptase-like protein n=1 Tax=Sutcliffiella horikoshii TaxID=79883 RepID=UPI001CBC1395|nr:reverse transcriptase-like protein [Sutcliffiella horikoshii]UAL45696.1 reverse transcriptase-like protein [Sutcliffiella horikoshii]
MKLTLEWHYHTPKHIETTFRSDELDIRLALRLAEDIEKTGRVKRLSFFDQDGSEWTKKEINKWIKQSEVGISDVVAYFDGGYDTDTKLAGIGNVVYYNQNRKDYRYRINARIEELESNNEAEYAAFYFLVQQLEYLEIRSMEVTFKGDSLVVLNQLSGEWPCYDDLFNRWLDKIEQKLKELKIRPVYEPVNRKDNTEAHQLAKQALEGTPIESKLQL